MKMNRRLHDEIQRLVGFMADKFNSQEKAEELLIKQLKTYRKTITEGTKRIEKEFWDNHKPMSEA